MANKDVFYYVYLDADRCVHLASKTQSGVVAYH